MDLDQKSDYSLRKIREKLNQDEVKLWLAPYYSEKEGKNDAEIENLAKSFSSQLSIPIDICLECLQRLQTKALDNLKERQEYQKTGKANLKVRVSNEQGGRLVPICMGLMNTGFSLREAISREVSVSMERLKIIFKGKVLKDEETLEAQGVKHGFQLMAIILTENTENLRKFESHNKLLDSTKKDVQLLANSVDDEYIQIADQSGKALQLPAAEKKALILAMTLHEKGRAALKREDHALALFMLLEAEKEFSRCNSALLKSVDNYGLLNLDIAWCYLNLQSLSQLPDAEERLLRCESSFHRSYGANLERLIALKGSAGNETALFMRLHLLQAVVNYHQNKFDKARELLKKAEDEINHLKVDDNLITQLVELGYGITEARLALRESQGNVNAAVTIIENKRLERKKNAEAEAQERKLNKERRALGKCLNGNWIEPQFHKALTSMGYSHEASKWALAQSNNNIYTSISLIQDHKDFIPESVSAESLEQVVGVGYDRRMAKLALKKHGGDVNKAVEELATNGGIVTDLDNLGADLDSDSENGPSTSKKCAKHNPDLEKKRLEAYSRVAEDISVTEEDHLDLNLVAEVEFLKKYKDLLSER